MEIPWPKVAEHTQFFNQNQCPLTAGPMQFSKGHYRFFQITLSQGQLSHMAVTRTFLYMNYVDVDYTA